MARNKLLHNQNDTDPMGTVANLFDVAMVFAVASMVALVSRFNMTEIFSKEDYTMVKNLNDILHPNRKNHPVNEERK